MFTLYTKNRFIQIAARQFRRRGRPEFIKTFLKHFLFPSKSKTDQLRSFRRSLSKEQKQKLMLFKSKDDMQCFGIPMPKLSHFEVHQVI